MTGGGARKPANKEFEIPELELKDPLAPKSSAPPPVGRFHPAAPSPYSGAPAEDDMMVDRNGMPEPISVSTTRAKAPPIVAHQLPHAGPSAMPIEVARPPPSRARISSEPEAPEVRPFDAGSVLSLFIVAVGFAAAAAPLVRFVHRSFGWKLPAFFHYALDGGSAIWSGSAALATLALTIVFAIMGTYARPRSAAYLFSGLGMLLVAISLIIIAFTVGPDGPPEIPPDGARLVPFVVPAIPLGIGLRLLRNAWTACEVRTAGARLKGLLAAAASGATLFVAVELVLGAVATARG
jgi:hypothetical protein